jgi:hypothetical protein
MITCKDSARFAVLRYEMYSQWDKVEAVFKQYGYPCILTCGTDGHGSDDPHSHGFAYDLRNWHLRDDALRQVVLEELQKALGPIYAVIWEKEVKDAAGKVIKGSHYHWQVRIGLWRSMI